MVDVYPIKKQNYAQFQNADVRWDDVDGGGAQGLFAGPFQRFTYLVTTPEVPMDSLVQAEWERAKDELGFPVSEAKEVTSGTGTAGKLQVFQRGEIYVHGNQAYALYGPILDHYREKGGFESGLLGFPTSSIQAVTSSTEVQGSMVEFEGNEDWPARIYLTWQGTAAAWGWIGYVYVETHQDHRGWLGFPLTDEQWHPNCSVQMFEGGYIVYYLPEVGEDRDWSRVPIAYPYLSAGGTLLDVHAVQEWQDTGVYLDSGDRVTVVQAGGAWGAWEEAEPFDANGSGEKAPPDVELPSATFGALIGRIGDGDAFPVGRWYTFTAPREGNLYLSMNDNRYEDNVGLVTVQIIVGDLD
jgi:hypothetical protein